MKSDIWTDERKEALRMLWPMTEISAQQIATRLGCGFSRNAVIGKAYRMGLPRRACNTMVRRKGGQTRKRQITKADKPKPVLSAVTKAVVLIARLPLPAEEEAPIGLKTIDELEPHDCRWFYGDPKKIMRGFCGCKAIPGTSWCAKHMISRPGSPGVYTLPKPERIAMVEAVREVEAAE